MNYPLIIAIMIILITALILLSPLLPVPDPYSAYNIYWNGYSKAITICNATVRYYGTNNASVIMLIPMMKPSITLINELINFTRSGGVLIIISNGEYYGNYILRAMGINAEFSNSSIIDPIMNYVNPSFPIAVVSPTYQGIIGTQYLLLDNSSYIVLMGNEDAVIIAETSPFSEVNGVNGPFPVITKMPYGSGSVVLIASPSMFMNSMINYYGNSALLHWLCSGGNVVFLEGFIAKVTPLAILRVYGHYAYTGLRTLWTKYLIVVLPIAIVIVIMIVDELRGGGNEE